MSDLYKIKCLKACLENQQCGKLELLLFRSFSVVETNFFQSIQGYGSLQSSSCKNALCRLNCCIMRLNCCIMRF